MSQIAKREYTIFYILSTLVKGLTKPSGLLSSLTMNKKQISKIMSEFGKKGGAATLEKHGVKHFKEAAKKGVEARKNKALRRKALVDKA